MIRGQTSPSVSVIVPAYNSAATIDAALESVRAQTWTDWECIVVDDASTDETREKVRSSEFGGQGVGVRGQEVSRGGAEDAEEEMVRGQGAGLQVRLIALDRNGGPAAARNAGAAVARGEWLAFLDADDMWAAHRLAVQMTAARAIPEVGMWCAETLALAPSADARVETDNTHGSADDIPTSEALDRGRFAVFNPVATSTVLLKRVWFLEAGGFDESFRGPEDYDLWIRIAAAGPIRKIGRSLAFYRRTDGSLSLNDRTFLPQVLRVLEKAYGPGGALNGMRGKRKAQCYQYMAAAWSAASRGDVARALRLYCAALLRWPFTLKPQVSLPWGRLRLGIYLLKRSALP